MPGFVVPSYMTTELMEHDVELSRWDRDNLIAAIEALRAKLDDAHATNMAIPYIHFLIASIQNGMKDKAEAIEHCRQACASLERSYGLASKFTLTVLCQLGTLYRQHGQPRDSFSTFQRILDQVPHEPDNPFITHAYLGKARALTDLDDNNEAHSYYMQAAARAQPGTNPYRPDPIATLIELGRSCICSGAWPAATEVFVSAFNIQQRLPRRDGDERWALHAWIALTYQLRGLYDKAVDS